MSEHDEQVTVCEYLKALNLPFYAVPNAAKRSLRLAKWYKDEGLSAGVPDLCIPVARGGFHSLYIEMKRPDGSTKDITDNQIKWAKRLSDEGMAVLVCFGAEKAIACVDWYLNLT